MSLVGVCALFGVTAGASEASLDMMQDWCAVV